LQRCTSRGRLPLYQLLQIIFDEGQFVQMQARLLSEGELRRQLRRQCQDNNGKSDALLDDYERKRRTTFSLLRACNRLQCPRCGRLYWTSEL